MGKRKPDPPTQKLILPDVASNLLHVFKEHALLEFNVDDGDFDKLPPKEQRKILTKFFEVMVERDMVRETSQLTFDMKLRNYASHQRFLAERRAKDDAPKNECE